MRDALLLTRNFYGSLRVKHTDERPFANQPPAPERMMLNGTIQHGTQIFSAALQHTPTTYYAANSGIGLALSLCCNGRPRNIGVIGLGAGTLAAYGRPGDRFRFYELNPRVEPIARNLFTYLRDSPAQNTVINGDARASLAAEPSQKFDVLAIDAFSGDAIPLHLLTTQAIALYQRHLAPGGILAFHVSNQYVDLAPEIALLAANAHLQSARIDSSANPAEGAYRATWVLISANSAVLAQPTVAHSTTRTTSIAGIRLWTDDYSSLLPLLKF
jgi:spermidine synthase